MESQYSMLLGWMILSMLLGWMILNSILTTKCYYYNPGKSNEQTLHEETTYSCWHAGTNNEQTSPRTTAPIFQSQTVWSVAALKFWKNEPYSKFMMLSSENFGYDIMWHPEKLMLILWAGIRKSWWYPQSLWLVSFIFLKYWWVHSGDIFRQVR